VLCAQCMQMVFTYLIHKEAQQKTVDVVKGVNVSPSSGVLVCLLAM